MKFPFVSRSHHEEMVAELRRQLEERTRELHRIKDLIFKQQFGVQLYDTLPAEAQPEPEAPKTREDAIVESLEDADRQAKNRIASLWRTSPSKVGPALAQELRNKQIRQAHAARPMHPEVQRRFEQAKEEASN